MWVRSSGNLSENTHLINSPLSSHLLVFGEGKSAFIDASAAAHYPVLEGKTLEAVSALCSVSDSPDSEISFPSSGLKSKGAPEKAKKDLSVSSDFKLDYLLITHSHFDHVSSIPLFKLANPDLQVICSASTSEIISSKEFQEECWNWNKQIAKSLKLKLPITKAKWFANFTVDHIIGSGDSLDLGGGVSIKGFSLPGHSDDSMGYFVQPDDIFQGGEITGSYGGRGVTCPSFSKCFQTYLASLEKIISLEPRGIVLAHGGCLRGDLSHKHLLNLKSSSEELFKTIKDRLAQGELQQEIAESLAVEFKSENKFPEGPFQAFHSQAVQQMVESVSKISGSKDRALKDTTKETTAEDKEDS